MQWKDKKNHLVLSYNVYQVPVEYLQFNDQGTDPFLAGAVRSMTTAMDWLQVSPSATHSFTTHTTRSTPTPAQGPKSPVLVSAQTVVHEPRL